MCGFSSVIRQRNFNGRESSSKLMLKNFGLELTSPVNFDPLWKVSKGSRSASRRVRKSVSCSLKFFTGLGNRSLEASNMPVSGSEKRGASMLDCRFSVRPEHVPIKKRRFLLRASSPPPPPPPFITSETASVAKTYDASDKFSHVGSAYSDINLSKNIDDTDSNHDETSEKASKSSVEDENFSGISILAAAACSSNLGRESWYAEDGAGVEESSAQGQAWEVSAKKEALSSSVGFLKEDLVNSSEISTGGTSSCVSTEPFGELASMSAAANSAHKIASCEGTRVVALKVDSSILSADVSYSKDEETMGIKKLCSQDDRLQWDLNVVMDAWEHPFESPKGHNDVPYAISHDTGKNNHNDNEEGLEGRGLLDKLANQSLEVNKLYHNIGCCHDVVQCTGQDSKSMCYNTTIKPAGVLINSSSNLATHPDASGAVNEEDGSVPSLRLNGLGHLKGRPTLEGLNLSGSRSYCALENLRNESASNDMQSSLSASSCSDILRQVIPDLAVLGNMGTCLELQHNVNKVTEKDGLKTTDHPSQCIEVPNSISTICEHPVGLDTEVQGVVVDTKINRLSKETNDSLSHDTKANLDKRSNVSDKIKAPKAVNRNGCADVYLNPTSSAGNDAVIELPRDLDFQYEDGEFRKQNEHQREGYDVVDRDVEHVEYELDDTDICTTMDYCVSESRYIEHGVVGEATKPMGDNGPHEQGTKLILNSAPEGKMEVSKSQELLERKTSSDLDIALSNDDWEKERLASYPETNVESTPFRKGLLSRIEGPVVHDTSSQEERLNKVELRHEESSSMRSFERAQCSFNNQGRGLRADSRNSFQGNRRGGFRRHYSHIVHRHDPTMERDYIRYASVGEDGPYSHQLCQRSRSGADKDEYTKSIRTFSPDRPSTFGRGKSVRYGSFKPSGDESFQSSLKYRRPLSCSQRSFSPFGGRSHSNAHNFRGKLPSQSRSRSPIMWNSPRGQRGGGSGGSGGSSCVRQRSSSPNFRSEVRMQRLSSAHHQPDCQPDDCVGFRSIPRSHDSSPHGRWTSAGKEEMGQFKEFGYKQRAFGLDRSPVTIRIRGDRGGVLDSPRDLRPEGYYRTSEDAACRGPNYEERFEGRRKYNGPLHPARHGYDNDDGYSIGKGIQGRDASDFPGRGVRGMDSRIMDHPRRFRGEEHSFVCKRDGKFNSVSKQFGVDMMDL